MVLLPLGFECALRESDAGGSGEDPPRRLGSRLPKLFRSMHRACYDSQRKLALRQTGADRETVIQQTVYKIRLGDTVTQRTSDFLQVKLQWQVDNHAGPRTAGVLGSTRLTETSVPHSGSPETGIYRDKSIQGPSKSTLDFDDCSQTLCRRRVISDRGTDIVLVSFAGLNNSIAG